MYYIHGVPNQSIWSDRGPRELDNKKTHKSLGYLLIVQIWHVLQTM